MEYILQPWPWHISGFLIAVVMFLLVFMGNTFGVSSNLRTICTICGAGKRNSFFNFNWKTQKWNLLFVFGAIIGGFISVQFLGAGTQVDLSASSLLKLKSLSITFISDAFLPEELYNLNSFKNIVLLALGGFLVGFGTRYAGGCTSGHAISGLSNLQLPSLIAVAGFFIGGLVMVHLLFPLIF